MAKITDEDKTIPQLIGGTDKHAIIEYFRNLDRKKQATEVAGGQEVRTVNNYSTTINRPCNGTHAAGGSGNRLQFEAPAMLHYMQLTDWLLMVVIILLFILIIKRS